MRALLVVNPGATATRQRGRDVLARALGSEMKVEVIETDGRGHAIELARDARAAGTDLVVALGGDGTVNEIVNGLLAEDVGDDTPMLAVVPGGAANVFSRSLGFSRDPIVATGEILDALRARRSRQVGLGQAGPRWFLFNAGFGFDAEVVHRVERYRRDGRDASAGLYIRSALAEFLAGTDRRRPAITMHPGDDGPSGAPAAPGDPVEGLFFAIISNATPWTYAGSHPLTVAPHADFDTGLDIFASRTMRSAPMARWAAQTLRHTPRFRGRAAVSLHDVSRFRLTSDRPIGLQVDGDYLGQQTSVGFTARPAAIRVVG
ncbi:MAG: diacylglycerol/lipid kinase family protein [Mycobacteriales bacterium]